MRLSQLIAIVTGRKPQLKAAITESHKKCQKSELFNGLTRVYKAINDDDPEILPAENKVVITTASKELSEFSNSFSSLLDFVYAQEEANTLAKADVKIADGTVVLSQVPVSFLLFLEKELVDAVTFFSKLPVLDPTETWSFDSGTSLYTTQEVRKTRSRKTSRVLTRAEATQFHPAQTELVAEDVPVGVWTEKKMSGAVTEAYKTEKIKKLRDLIDAVKSAREEANSLNLPDKLKAVGSLVLSHIL